MHLVRVVGARAFGGRSDCLGYPCTMTIGSFEGQSPHVGRGSWVHPSADVLDDERIGERCWIGPGARLRGDYGHIVRGVYCAVEDHCVVHARPGETRSAAVLPREWSWPGSLRPCR
jgi:UDP-3-O-[3-hydroxymyristoyl] glucosamine N-acyltransferase